MLTYEDPNELKWNEENPQRILIPIQFKFYQNPGNEEHIKQVLKNYFAGKGVEFNGEEIRI
jgi:hypothetical protein